MGRGWMKWRKLSRLGQQRETVTHRPTAVLRSCRTLRASVPSHPPPTGQESQQLQLGPPPSSTNLSPFHITTFLHTLVYHGSRALLPLAEVLCVSFFLYQVCSPPVLPLSFSRCTPPGRNTAWFKHRLQCYSEALSAWKSCILESR